MAMNPNTLSQDDQQVVNVAQRDGIAILPDLLTPAEVDLVRQDFDQLHIDLGKGPGKAWTGKLRGGVVGLIFDTRGRPIRLPLSQEERTPLIQEWVQSVGEYPIAEGA